MCSTPWAGLLDGQDRLVHYHRPVQHNWACTMSCYQPQAIRCFDLSFYYQYIHLGNIQQQQTRPDSQPSHRTTYLQCLVSNVNHRSTAHSRGSDIIRSLALAGTCAHRSYNVRFSPVISHNRESLTNEYPIMTRCKTQIKDLRSMKYFSGSAI